jgi:hypothetical protein
MINKKSTIYALAGILLSLNALTQAKFGDWPLGHRDYNEPARPAGLLHEERGGERYFAPLTPVKEVVGAYDYDREYNDGSERRYNDGSYKYDDNDYSNE